VGLIQDENLEAVASRSEDGTLAKIAGIVYTVVAGSVDFDDIKRASTIARKLNAAWALSARSVGWALGAVEAASQDSS
jgi:hypothetical protein